MRKSISQSKRTTQRYKSSVSPRKKSSQQSPLYFCHYKNGMYMGGINAFQKHGKGIIIHDSGISALTNYYNDIKHGHNVYYLQNCLISVQFVKNKFKEVVLRVPGYLLFMKYNKEQQQDGKCILLNYSTKSITYAIFRKGVMIQKSQEQQYAVINRVFDLNNLQFIVGRVHSKVLNFELEKDQNIVGHKLGNKFSLGFNKKGLINGLGFTLFTKPLASSYNPDTHRNQDQFFLRPVERGYFLNSQLNGLGQKWFKNGNIYFGDFKGDVFEGHGILKNTVKNNWVSAYFERGNMAELFDYSHEGELKKYVKLVQAMHEKKTNWISKDLQLIETQIFFRQIQNILNNNPTSQMKILQQKKRQVLKKIQDNFICDSPRDSPMTQSRNIQSYHEIEADGNIKHPNISNLYMKGFTINKNQDQSSNRKDLRKEESFDENIESSGKRDLRKSKIFEKNDNYRSYSADLIKLHEVPNTKDSSVRRENKKQLLKNEQPPRNQMKLSKSTFGKNYQKISSPSFNLDSKRIIGKSRIFKYLNSQSQENPPQFNYNLND